MVPSPGTDPDDAPDDDEERPVTSDGAGATDRFWNEGPDHAPVEEEGPIADDGSGSPADGSAAEADGSSDDDAVRWIGRRVLAVVVAYGLALLGFLLVFPYTLPTGLVLALLGVDVRSPIISFLVGFVVLQGMAFPTVAVGYLGFRRALASAFDREFDLQYVRVRLPSLRDVGWTAAGYVAVFALVFVSLIVVSLLDAPTAQRSNQAVFENAGALLWMIPISFLLIGPGEELLFRGIIQDRLREAFSAPAAILLASAAFAPLHIFALTGGVQALATTIAVLFVPSLIFGITYEATGNLTVPIVIHGAYDATIFGVGYVTLVMG